MKYVQKALCTAVAALLLTGSAAPASAAETAEGKIQTGDVVCFGETDEDCGFDGKWLVLDSQHTNDGQPGMYLVLLNLIGDEQGEDILFRDIGDVSVSFSNRGEDFAAAHPGTTDYQGSNIQAWCETFAQTHLSQAEYGALLPTHKSDEAVTIPGLGIPLPGAPNGTVDFSPVTDILDGDKLFLLSAEEVTNPAYGFTDGSARIAQFKGTPQGYWLRSPHIPTFPLDVGFVFSFGAVMDFPVNANFMFDMRHYVRPACNLDSEKIAAAEVLAVNGEKTIWRLSFRDGERNERLYDTTLPQRVEAMDLAKMVKTALTVAACVLVVLVVLVVLLVRANLRKRRKKKAKQ